MVLGWRAPVSAGWSRAMIELHRSKTAGGDVSVTLDRATGAVSYLKRGTVQTMVDAQGRNLTPQIDEAVKLLSRAGVGRVLVLGHGGGAASTLLYKSSVEVISVDCDACAEGLGQIFFRAPPSLSVVVADASDYVRDAAPASFDAVLVDLQESTATPDAYLSGEFWNATVGLVRAPGMVLTHVARALIAGPDWPRFRSALSEAWLDCVALSEALDGGSQLLVSWHPRG
jgi:predicted membrane-bound spermidine synthase